MATNPLTRGTERSPFVGREPELERLRELYEASKGGGRRLLLIAGEPGIGKTRLAEEFEAYARERGALVLWGRSRETAGAPPYWPWIQMSRALGDSLEDDALRLLLAPDAAELQRVFLYVRTLIPNLPAAPEADDAGAQFRFFDAVTAFFRRLTDNVPVVLVLDDLHWADRATLLLLVHLAAELRDSRLLLVGTYREAEVGRDHPLRQCLAEFNRISGVERISLSGLTEADTAEYMRAAYGAAPPEMKVRQTYEMTEGNPFFLGQVLRLLAQRGSPLDDTSTLGVPEGVREVLAQRLKRLSTSANELLRVAAVVGREFTYETLSLLEGSAASHSLVPLEEALSSGIVEETANPGRYRFVHALMRETVLAELSATRRLQTHGLIGEALERRWGDLADERAPRLASHFFEAATLSQSFAQRAVRYGKLAAGQAERVAAWSEAADLYGRCLALMEEARDDFGEDRAALLHRRGRCAQHAAEWRTAWRCLMTALDLYRERGDAVGQARVIMDALETATSRSTEFELIDKAERLLDDLAPGLQAGLIARMLQPRAPRDLRQGPEEQRLEERLRAILKEDANLEAEGRMLVRDSLLAYRRAEFEASAAMARHAYLKFVESGNIAAAADALNVAGAGFMGSGEFDRFEQHLLEQLEFARKWHGRQQVGLASFGLAGIYLLRRDPRYGEAVAQIPPRNPSFDIYRAVEAEIAGDLNRAVELLPPVERAAGVPELLLTVLGHRARILHAAGRTEEARSEFEAWRTGLPEARPSASPSSEYSLHAYVSAREAIVALGDLELVRRVYDDLVAHSTWRFEILGVSGIDVIRGALALHLGLVDAAEGALPHRPRVGRARALPDRGWPLPAGPRRGRPAPPAEAGGPQVAGRGRRHLREVWRRALPATGAGGSRHHRRSLSRHRDAPGVPRRPYRA
jgi:hypothetical protein